MTESAYLDAVRASCARNHASAVVLFGSRARGTNRPESDFDVAVYGVPDVGPIVEELEELPTLYSADVVNMDRPCSEGLRQEVEQHGIRL